MSTLAINSGLTRTRVATSRTVRRTPAPVPIRLTRRGRVVLVLLMLGVMLVALAVLGPQSAATGEAGTPVQTRTVEIAVGDTLWGIASRVAKPGQTREMVDRIEELNALTGPGVAVGQEIAVPVR